MTLLRNQVVVLIIEFVRCSGRVNMETEPTNTSTQTGAGKWKRDLLLDAAETRSTSQRFACIERAGKIQWGYIK